MSSLREELASIDADIKDITDKQTTLSEQEYSLYRSRLIVIKNIIAEEEVFKNTKWELLLGTINNNISLQYITEDEDKLSNIRQICFHSWHDSFELEDGITLHFDDGEYTLVGDPGQLKAFAVKHNLIIIAKDIDEKLRKLSRQLTNLQEICHQFNLK